MLEIKELYKLYGYWITVFILVGYVVTGDFLRGVVPDIEKALEVVK